MGSKLLTPQLARKICDRLATGESLRSICRDKDMPDEKTVRTWVMGNEQNFAPQYARAREIGYDCMAEEIIELADKPVRAKKKVTKGDGTIETVEGDNVERTKVQIDARKWMLAKMLPKRYGDKQQLDLSGTLTLSEIVNRSLNEPSSD